MKEERGVVQLPGGEFSLRRHPPWRISVLFSSSPSTSYPPALRQGSPCSDPATCEALSDRYDLSDLRNARRDLRWSVLRPLADSKCGSTVRCIVALRKGISVWIIDGNGAIRDLQPCPLPWYGRRMTN